MKFNLVKSDAFQTMQFEAGLLLTTFDPTGATAVDDGDIISATTGGITATCTPTLTDLGADVDNAPLNTKELAEIDSWACTFATTLLEMSAAAVKLALGAADADESAGTVTPRATVKQTDFSTVWWVGDLKGGGAAAIQLTNAMSTGGFSLQTTKKGAGQLGITLTGFATTADPNLVPMKFYLSDDGFAAGGE